VIEAVRGMKYNPDSSGYAIEAMICSVGKMAFERIAGCPFLNARYVSFL